MKRLSLTQWLLVIGFSLVAVAVVALYISARSHVPEAAPRHHDLDLVSGDFSDILVWHDRVRKVTCWQGTATGGVSCIPDWQLAAPDGGSR